jgi:hypothetical protein
MKSRILLILFAFTQTVIAQKKILDASAFTNWDRLSESGISSDGNYIFYGVSHNVNGKTSIELIIKSRINNYEHSISNASFPAFTSNSLYFICCQNDSVIILNLKNTKTRNIQSSSYKLFKNNYGEYIAYNQGKLVKLININDLRDITLDKAENLKIGLRGNIFFEKKDIQDSSHKALCIFDFQTERPLSIWTGKNNEKLFDFVFSKNDDKLSFSTTSKIEHKSESTIWIYNLNSIKAVQLLPSKDFELDKNFELGKPIKFTADGKRLFFTIIKAINSEGLLNNKVKELTVWSYLDAKNQDSYLNSLKHLQGTAEQTILAAVTLNNLSIMRLTGNNETPVFFGEKTCDYLIIQKNGLETTLDEEPSWNKSYTKAEYYKISLDSGNRAKVNNNPLWGASVAMSPAGNCLIVVDQIERDFFSINLITGRVINITKQLHVPVEDEDYDLVYKKYKPRGLFLLAWTKNGQFVIIRSKYDLWLIDVSGKNEPFNLTNGYGQKHLIEFRFLENSQTHGELNFDIGQTIVIAGFNNVSKDNGFFQIILGKKIDPEKLTMGPYLYYASENLNFTPDDCPIKAKNSNIWLIKRESANKSKNLFWTTNFKIFYIVSNIFPEQNYNWLTSELIEFNIGSYKKGQACIFKPENFDVKHKYPIIIHYYEKLSSQLNKFRDPEPISNNLQIPWFVSRGYVVVVPDIYYEYNSPGQSAYNSVVGVAKYLKGLKWVDSKKMGIQGHSFGGYETNYIITHSNLFAAAMSSSGVSDLVSNYNAITLKGLNRQDFHQYRMSSPLWELPSNYIQQSPIFYVKNVTTSLLMMNNKHDGAVNFSQGIEFFMSLRRLGKPVWMLQYEGDGHSLSNWNNAVNHTFRVTQFFDHYLKDMPAPKWMTGSAPGTKNLKKHIDTETKPPGSGLIRSFSE